MIDWSKIKDFGGKYKWWLIVGTIAIIYIVVIIILVYKKNKGKNFNRRNYKTITPEQAEKLETLHDEVKERFYQFVEAINKKGYKAEITSSYRSFQKQQEIKNKYGSIAATPGKSPHNYGLALDIVLYDKNGKKYGNKNIKKSEWESTGVPAMARKMGFRWGGDFKNHPFDPVHFDLVDFLGVTTADLFKKAKEIYGSPEKIIGNEIPLR